MVKLPAAEGLADVSMERVAAATVISKVTMYTRWRNRAELVGAALNQLQVDDLPESTGHVRGDFIAHLSARLRGRQGRPRGAHRDPRG